MEPTAKTANVNALRWWGRTDRGKVRKNNEDAFLGVCFDAREVRHLGKIGEAPVATQDFAFAVSDGMGGAKAGEYASSITVEKIAKLLPKSFKQSALGLQSDFEDIFEELYEQIHRALVFVGGSYEETQGMEATLTLAWFSPAWMFFAHVGDTRLYYLPKSATTIKQVSEDDTYVGWLYRTGKIKEWEARTHPQRNVLQKALGGSNQFVNPQVGAIGYEPGDTFLLCSDGLTEGLYGDSIVEFIREEQARGGNPAHRLVDESISRDGRDNVTALVVQAV
jgi:serine/threonine protein phosphatase PrpC